MAMRIRIRHANIDQDLRDWFELWGKEVVGLALGLGTQSGAPGLSGGVMMTTNAVITILNQQDAAAKWLREQRDRDERREAFRFWGMLVLTLIAAVGAVIAAFPIIKDWWS
jgi:hypothetical protein